ncbi:MAG: class I SAM-dependent methyltransferase [Candidatus Hodarchaeota archaeon]
MSHSRIINKYIMQLIPDDVINYKILDVGCGYGEWGYILKVRKKSNYLITGIDVFEPYIKKLRKFKIYDNLIIADVINYKFNEKYDIILVCEVLEHLKKEDGLKLLNDLEFLYKDKIILSVPYGFTTQNTVDNNIHQKHISSWNPMDFKNKKYNVKVIQHPIRLKKILLKLCDTIFKSYYCKKTILAYKD